MVAGNAYLEPVAIVPELQGIRRKSLGCEKRRDNAMTPFRVCCKAERRGPILMIYDD